MADKLIHDEERSAPQQWSHRHDCALARLLRVYGGAEETQRQVYQAWGDALRSRYTHGIFESALGK